jgi:hypothetical protein
MNEILGNRRFYRVDRASLVSNATRADLSQRALDFRTIGNWSAAYSKIPRKMTLATEK